MDDLFIEKKLKAVFDRIDQTMPDSYGSAETVRDVHMAVADLHDVIKHLVNSVRALEAELEAERHPCTGRSNCHCPYCEARHEAAAMRGEYHSILGVRTGRY